MNLPLPDADSEPAARRFRLFILLFFLFAYASLNARLVQLSETSLHQIDITSNATTYGKLSATATRADTKKVNFHPLNCNNFLVQRDSSTNALLPLRTGLIILFSLIHSTSRTFLSIFAAYLRNDCHSKLGNRCYAEFSRRICREKFI